jgi:hypothetical protein
MEAKDAGFWDGWWRNRLTEKYESSLFPDLLPLVYDELRKLAARGEK